MTEQITWVEHLRSLPYEEYLATTHWRVARESALERAHHRCERGGERNQALDVYHRTYANLGREMPADLVALCRRCHDEIHAAPGAFRDASLTLGQSFGALAALKRPPAPSMTPDEIDEAAIQWNRRPFQYQVEGYWDEEPEA